MKSTIFIKDTCETGCAVNDNLKHSNFLSEFKTESEKRKARENLGLGNLVDFNTNDITGGFFVYEYQELIDYSKVTAGSVVYIISEDTYYKYNGWKLITIWGDNNYDALNTKVSDLETSFSDFKNDTTTSFKNVDQNIKHINTMSNFDITFSDTGGYITYTMLDGFQEERDKYTKIIPNIGMSDSTTDTTGLLSLSDYRFFVDQTKIMYNLKKGTDSIISDVEISNENGQLTYTIDYVDLATGKEIEKASLPIELPVVSNDNAGILTAEDYKLFSSTAAEYSNDTIAKISDIGTEVDESLGSAPEFQYSGLISEFEDCQSVTFGYYKMNSFDCYRLVRELTNSDGDVYYSTGWDAETFNNKYYPSSDDMLSSKLCIGGEFFIPGFVKVDKNKRIKVLYKLNIETEHTLAQEYPYSAKILITDNYQSMPSSFSNSYNLSELGDSSLEYEIDLVKQDSENYIVVRKITKSDDTVIYQKEWNEEIYNSKLIPSSKAYYDADIILSPDTTMLVSTGNTLKEFGV